MGTVVQQTNGEKTIYTADEYTLVQKALADINTKISNLPTDETSITSINSQLAEKAQQSLINIISTNLTTGDIIVTTGFYNTGDGGEAFYQVENLSGSETWSDSGLGFSLTSNGEIKAGTKKLKYIVRNGIINVRHFGAKGDYNDTNKTGTDNTTIIQRVFDFAYVAPIDSMLVRYDCPTVLFPSDFGYCITSTVTCKEGVNINMTSSSLVLLGTTSQKAIVIGEASQRSYNAEYTIDVRRSQQLSAPDTTNDIGVEIINPYYCKIYIKGSRLFSIGARLVGDSKGAVYNTVNLGFLTGSNIFLDIMGRNSGWGNENLFLGGEFQNGVQNCFGVRISNDQNSIVYSDNNLFVKPSFELNGASGYQAIPFLIQDATSTKVLAMRLEDANGNTPYIARFTGIAQNSDIEVSAGGSDINAYDDQSTNRTNFVHRRKWNFTQVGKEIFSTEALHKKACYYDGSTNVNVPELHFIQLDITSTSAYKNAITIASNGLTLPSSRGLGRFVDTSIVKKFTIQSQSVSGCSYYFRCYDANGNVLMPSSSNVYAYSGDTGLAITTGGNAYWTSSPTSGSLSITFTDAVKYVGMYVGNGTVSGFSISAIDMINPYANTWSGYEEIEKGVNLGTTPPTAGTWSVGRRIRNATPTVGQPKAWVCTASGTPGTWVSEGNL